MQSDSTLIPWDGQPRRLKAWERDLYFRDAFHVSCVPCYQEIARQIGVERMREYLEKLHYGEMAVDSSNINVWFFATNIDPEKEFDMEMFPKIRKEITMKALAAIGLIPS
jgi:beta-lactamase class D